MKRASCSGFAVAIAALVKGDHKGITLGYVERMCLDGSGRPHRMIPLLFGGACCFMSDRAERIANRAVVNQGIFQ